MDWTYSAIILTAIGAALAVFLAIRQPLGLSLREKLGICLGGFVGGMLGAKLPFVLYDWQGFLSGAAWFHDGKTIVAGLVGGYVGAEIAERLLGTRVKLCDQLAPPLALGIAIGRLGCWHAGCCFGTTTCMPWGVDFGDGLRRHPTQLYEAAFHFAAFAVLLYLYRRKRFPGQLIRGYFVAYFLYRFLTEFLRPEPRYALGLTAYQWAALALIPCFALWSCGGWNALARSWWWRRRRRFPPLWDVPGARLMRRTQTLCPACLAEVLGETFLRDGRVFLRRRCPVHGETTALVSSDRRHYYLRDEVPHPPPGEGGGCCGTGAGHCTCVGLLEITEACNLSCPVCYANSPSGRHRPLAALQADLAAFLQARGRLDVLQLSGGEPLLHPDLLALIDHAKTLPIKMVMINTNGLLLTRREGLAAELARRVPRLELSLQLDGLDQASHQALRGADLLAEKRAVLETIVAHRLPTTLVCTVARHVNEEQLGPLLQLGLRTRTVRGLTLQPAMWSGRFEPQRDLLDRVTLAEVLTRLVRQSGGVLRESDFHPLPCSHPNCCSFTVLSRRAERRPRPLTRWVNFAAHVDQLADRLAFDLDDAAACGAAGRTPEDFFRIVIKPFMDAATYDAERIGECCVHMIRPGGRAVSFCEYNALHRGRTADPQLPLLGCAHDCQCP